MKIGIVGLPNVGKSTLFNALTKQSAKAQNVPFTTIEPNMGVVPVPDERLDMLATISKSKKVVPTTIEFVDIAGLVRGAHKGEGLGNQFLAHIREVDAIVHVVRAFDDSSIVHMDGAANPEADIETINTELALADLATVEKALERNEDSIKRHEKGAEKQRESLEKLQGCLADGTAARDCFGNHFNAAPAPSGSSSGRGRSGRKAASGYLQSSTGSSPERNLVGETVISELQLLTSKPVLYVMNVGDNQLTAPPLHLPLKEGEKPLVLSVKIEQELVELSDEERSVFLKEYGLETTGLDKLIRASYELLNLITFFTSGPQETRAWTVQSGSTAPQAAGKIHTDFERGFIRAETVAYDDLVRAGTYTKARAAGKVRDEGKEYIVKDGDVMLFKFSV